MINENLANSSDHQKTLCHYNMITYILQSLQTWSSYNGAQWVSIPNSFCQGDYKRNYYNIIAYLLKISTNIWGDTVGFKAPVV